MKQEPNCGNKKCHFCFTDARDSKILIKYTLLLVSVVSLVYITLG